MGQPSEVLGSERLLQGRWLSSRGYDFGVAGRSHRSEVCWPHWGDSGWISKPQRLKWDGAVSIKCAPVIVSACSAVHYWGSRCDSRAQAAIVMFTLLSWVGKLRLLSQEVWTIMLLFTGDVCVGGGLGAGRKASHTNAKARRSFNTVKHWIRRSHSGQIYDLMTDFFFFCRFSHFTWWINLVLIACENNQINFSLLSNDK